MSSDRPDTDDFAQFRQTFFEECAELLSALDEHLADLQEHAADTEQLNAIFRAVHSIKAGAGAFSFTRLVTFSHTYEALLDALRDGQVQQSEAVTSVLVRATDALATRVKAAQEGRELAPDFGEAEAADLNALLKQAGLSKQSDTPSDSSASTAAATAPETPTSTRYSIRFAPFLELFRHANEPLLLIRELMRLGTFTLSCDTSPLAASERDRTRRRLSRLGYRDRNRALGCRFAGDLRIRRRGLRPGHRTDGIPGRDSRDERRQRRNRRNRARGCGNDACAREPRLPYRPRRSPQRRPRQARPRPIRKARVLPPFASISPASTGWSTWSASSSSHNRCSSSSPTRTRWRHRRSPPRKGSTRSPR